MKKFIDTSVINRLSKLAEKGKVDILDEKRSKEEVFNEMKQYYQDMKEGKIDSLFITNALEKVYKNDR